jgi:cysteine desulfurase family protein
MDNNGASAGRGAYREAYLAGEWLARCRALLAQLLRIDEASRIAFTLNCTDALNLALKGTLRRGDHVVTTWMDHNSILRPLARMEEEGVITVTRVRASADGCVDPEAIRAACHGRTRMVATLHASNVSGSLQDVGAIGGICHELGILFLLDAAQTMGAMPLYPRELRIDLLAFPGHKGLMGPLGTGALYHSERVQLRSVREGGTGSRSEEATQPEFLPDRLEPGSHNLLGLAGLAAATEEILNRGVVSIYQHKRQLSRAFLDRSKRIAGLTVYGPSSVEHRVPVFSVALPGWLPVPAGEVLDREFGIKARAGLHCAPLAHQTLRTGPEGALRLSFGALNTLEDVERVALALEAMIQRGPSN